MLCLTDQDRDIAVVRFMHAFVTIRERLGWIRNHYVVNGTRIVLYCLDCVVL